MSDSTKKLTNWGRWGADDMLGTLNIMTPEGIKMRPDLSKMARHIAFRCHSRIKGPNGLPDKNYGKLLNSQMIFLAVDTLATLLLCILIQAHTLMH